MRSKKPEQMIENVYIDGYIEQRQGVYEGNLSIEGINLSPIVGVYFKEKGEHWLWIRRKDVMEYDWVNNTYVKRKAMPYVECYLKKQPHNKEIAYRGYLYFSHFKYVISGIYDKYLKDVDRLNLYVERLPMDEQTIIKSINLRKKKENEKRQ